MKLQEKIDEFNRKADEVEHLHWLEGTSFDNQGNLVYVDTPWAVGVTDKGGALINP